MIREKTRQRQRGATFEVAEKLSERRAAMAARAPEPPRAGDIFLSSRTAGFPVEWLVVDQADDGRVRVMPLDDHPFVGSRDRARRPAGAPTAARPR